MLSHVVGLYAFILSSGECFLGHALALVSWFACEGLVDGGDSDDECCLGLGSRDSHML